MKWCCPKGGGVAFCRELQKYRFLSIFIDFYDFYIKL